MQIIATVCMFLAGKVEETPRPIKDVIIVSYEIIHKKDPAASQRIKQKVFFPLFSENTIFTHCSLVCFINLVVRLSVLLFSSYFSFCDLLLRCLLMKNIIFH